MASRLPAALHARLQADAPDIPPWLDRFEIEGGVALAVDRDARRLLWAKADHLLELWDLQRRARSVCMRGHTERVNAVVFSADGRFGLSCSRDRTVRVWSLGDGSEITRPHVASRCR